MKKLRVRDVLLFVPAILLVVITVYPLLWTLCGSFNTVTQLGRISVIPVGVSLKNYIDIFVEGDFYRYTMNSLIVSVATVALQLSFNAMAAYPLARLQFPGKNLVFIYFLSTMMIPFSVTMIPLYLVVRNMKLVNTLWALILPAMASGFGIFMLRQFFLDIPKDLEEAALIDGMSYPGIFLKVILPLSKPILLSQGMFAFLGAWNSYLWPLIATMDEKLWVISVGIASFRDSRNVDWNAILTGATASMIPTAIMFAIFQKQLVEGIKTSGMKM